MGVGEYVSKRTASKSDKHSKAAAEARKKAMLKLGLEGTYVALNPMMKEKVNELAKEFVPDIVGKAGLGAASEHLINRFIQTGQVTDKDFMGAGLKGGLAEAGKYYYDTDFGQTNLGSIGGAGLLSGVGSAGSQLINKGEVDPVVTGGAIAKGAGQKAIANYAAREGLSKGAAGAAGAGYAGIIQAGVDLKNQRRVGKNTEFGMIGGMVGAVVGGPIGAAIGGVIGGGLAMATGADKATVRRTYTYNSPDGKDGIYFDKESGKFKLARPVDVSVRLVGAKNEYPNLSARQKANLLKKRQGEMMQEAQALHAGLTNMDTLGAKEQLFFEDRFSKHGYKAPKTEAEYKERYNEHLKAKYGKSYDILPESAIGQGVADNYDQWKKEYDRHNSQGTGYDWKRRVEDPDYATVDMNEMAWKRRNISQFNQLNQINEENKKKRGYFDPLLGWRNNEATDITDDNAIQEESRVLKQLQDKRDSGEELTATQKKALGQRGLLDEQFDPWGRTPVKMANNTGEDKPPIEQPPAQSPANQASINRWLQKINNQEEETPT